jgi:hypothetical protein
MIIQYKKEQYRLKERHYGRSFLSRKAALHILRISEINILIFGILDGILIWTLLWEVLLDGKVL